MIKNLLISSGLILFSFSIFCTNSPSADNQNAFAELLQLTEKKMIRDLHQYIMLVEQLNSTEAGRTLLLGLADYIHLNGLQSSKQLVQSFKAKRGRKPIDKTNLICAHCGTRDTPEWRGGPLGSNTLCNACGLQYSKRKRQREDEREPRVKSSRKKAKSRHALSYILNGDH
jgi:GATA zinc finger